jgi:hypothetical protein
LDPPVIVPVSTGELAKGRQKYSNPPVSVTAPLMSPLVCVKCSRRTAWGRFSLRKGRFALRRGRPVRR